MVSADDDPIELVPSRHEEWHEHFLTERQRVLTVLADQILESTVERIEHVGSTAVPHLAAKDIVDLDIVVVDDAVDEVSRILNTDLSGTRETNTEQWHPVYREHDGQRFNDHVFAVSSERWRISVLTCEVLRTYPELRDEYEQLKRELAAEHDDLVAYSTAKSEFIGRVLTVAEEDEEIEV